MSGVLMWCAGAIAGATFYVHTFIGGPRVVKPLLKCDTLPAASKWLSYYCWHIATVLLIFMTLALAAVALDFAHRDIAIFIGLLAATLSILSFVIAKAGGIAPWRFPSTLLFALISVTSLTAVFT